MAGGWISEAGVETAGDVAHELQVLALVLAHRHVGGAVGQHVGGHEHRVDEQPGGHELALGGGLIAELVHPVELAVGGHRRQQPGQLGVLLDVALAEEHAAGRVQAGREEDGQGVVHPLTQLDRVVGHGRGVQVDDAVEPLPLLLPRHVLADGPHVVAQVLAAGGLDAGEDAHGVAGYWRLRAWGCSSSTDVIQLAPTPGESVGQPPPAGVAERGGLPLARAASRTYHPASRPCAEAPRLRRPRVCRGSIRPFEATLGGRKRRRGSGHR